MLEVEVIGTAAIAPVEVERLATLAASSAGLEDGHVAIEFVDGDRIRDLNREFRGKDSPTDVLTFPIDGLGATGVPDGARELGEAVVHGVLHLTGMDHETDDGEMLALQREILTW